jgi:hypothetical protein
MTTEDRRVGKLLPSPVVPAGSVCFKITVPNAVQYRAALLGQLSILGDWHTWDHPTDGTVCADCDTAAQLWQKALYEATWSDECEDELNCDDVANCILTDENTQAAIAGFVGSSEEVQQAIAQYLLDNPAFTQNFYSESKQGIPLSSSQVGTSLTSDAACNEDNLFGSITAIVDQLNTNNIDFLEQFEIESNTIERARDLFAAIPLFETLPVDDALGFIDTVMGEFKEFYDAAYTTSLRDEYRCDLFCAALDRPNCDISFDILIDYFETRLGASLSNEALFGNMVEFLVAGSWSGTQIVDAMTLAQLVIWREASNFLGVSFRTLQTVGLLGANDPDSDWTLLCTECGDNCLPNWSSITWFQGTVSSHTGDFWNITSITPAAAPNDTVIRNVTYGNWTNGNYILKSIQNLTGGNLAQIYIERNNGTVLYNGTSVAAAQALLPACVRFIQVYRLESAGAFTMRFEIDN